MNENETDTDNLDEINVEDIDFDQLENSLETDLDAQMADLQILEQDREKIGNPETLGKTVMNVVWEQFLNQVGVKAGEDFIEENRNLTLDLRESAHIQTTENFEKGKIATHNDKIDYQERYDHWQANLQHDENGNVITHSTRVPGKQEATLVHGAREPFDKGRPTGSAENGTAMDHTISAAEIIRDPEANAHLSEQERVAFANSEDNLNEMDARQNQSKGDKPMTEWLDYPNSKGQKPDEIFDIDDKLQKQYREKDREARAEYTSRKQKGEQRSIETGKQSRQQEAARIGKKTIRAVIMGLLASLIKNVIGSLIVWFRSANRKLKTFIDSVKIAIKSFFSKIKEHLRNTANIVVDTVTTAIFGPIVRTIRKAWLFLKQGWKSIKEAIRFFRDPAHKSMPFSIKLLNVGKIIITGLTIGGALLLSDLIEKALMTIPIFASPIPLIGSVASILGIFLGALISGIIGALVLNLIDKALAKRQKALNEQQQITRKNEIMQIQDKLIMVSNRKAAMVKRQVAQNITDRHELAAKIANDLMADIEDNAIKSQEIHSQNAAGLADINNMLN